MRIGEIDIRGFRGLRELRLEDLTEVNLLVGRNNAGKTSVLEAVAALAGGGAYAPLLESCIRRGELMQGARRHIEVRHLFFGHAHERGAEFELRAGRFFARAALGPAELVAVEEWPDGELVPDEPRQYWVLRTEGHLMSGEVRLPMPPVKVEVTHQRPAVQFVGTTEEHYRDLGALWDRVLLTPAEDDVIRALGIIQPGVERLAYIGRASDARAAFGSFMVKFAGEKSERLPIGSMGDGMKRLLALSLHLVAAANGVLLVDEIDTGLHHSVLTKAWELTARTALANNTQVFATTHSLDCIRSLAWLCDGAPELRDRVSVHRIEADRPEAIRYSGHELITAIEHELEVR